ncbi:unnamed protein product [Effrenium voratum]|uniref:Uncharacterized protein n=1 Tax=Effrenium voratum TaxID=2562239 RepID=A0AA36IHP8_9DINO|nr:unnamed protein product [Effrenium voratum]
MLAARLREELALRRIGAATRIQSLARGKSIREEVGPLLASRREAAITLQCLVRGVAARRRLQLLRQERASVKVQSAWRRQLAKAEAMRRRAHEANKLLDCLLQGRVPPSDGTPRTGGKAWLEKVTAALEWKAKRDVEEEEKELRCCRQMAFSLIHHAQESSQAPRVCWPRPSWIALSRPWAWPSAEQGNGCVPCCRRRLKVTCRATSPRCASPWRSITAS